MIDMTLGELIDIVRMEDEAVELSIPLEWLLTMDGDALKKAIEERKRKSSSADPSKSRA